MTHAAPTSRRTRMLVMIGMVVAAGILIVLGTMWAGSQIVEYSNEPGGSTPPAPAQPIFTPPPTEIVPTDDPSPNGIPICRPEWQTTAGDGCNEPDIGTVIEGPNGETCVVVDEYGYTDCNLPDASGGEPPLSCD